jgi:hypothetical protein
MSNKYLTSMHKQTITYWANPVSDGYGGSTFDAPTTILGKWEDSAETFIDEKGHEQRSNAVAFISQDVDMGGYFYLGTSTESNPTDQAGAYEIRFIRKIPTYRGTAYERKVWVSSRGMF